MPARQGWRGVLGKTVANRAAKIPWQTRHTGWQPRCGRVRSTSGKTGNWNNRRRIRIVPAHFPRQASVGCVCYFWSRWTNGKKFVEGWLELWAYPFGPSKHERRRMLRGIRSGTNHGLCVPVGIGLKGMDIPGLVWAYMAKAYTVIDNLFTILRRHGDIDKKGDGLE